MTLVLNALLNLTIDDCYLLCRTTLLKDRPNTYLSWFWVLEGGSVAQYNMALNSDRYSVLVVVVKHVVQ